jgi:hypothetical protein
MSGAWQTTYKEPLRKSQRYLVILNAYLYAESDITALRYLKIILRARREAYMRELSG